MLQKMSLFALEIAILAFMHLCHEIIADFNATYFSVYPEVVFSLFMPNIYVFIFKFSCYVRAGGNIFFKETVDEISCDVKREYVRFTIQYCFCLIKITWDIYHFLFENVLVLCFVFLFKLENQYFPHFCSDLKGTVVNRDLTIFNIITQL